MDETGLNIKYKTEKIAGEIATQYVCDGAQWAETGTDAMANERLFFAAHGALIKFRLITETLFNNKKKQIA